MKAKVGRNKREVVVITGASAGVGRATVREFARHGAAIGLIARGTDGLEAARDEVERLGGQALVLPLDVSDASAVERAASEVEKRLGPIDVWVNDAMTSVFSPFKEMTPEEFRRVTDVTYLGYVYGTMAALKRMLPRDRGTIIQVGSALAYRGIPLQSAYCGAKHAIQGLVDSVRSELKHDRSRVRVIMVQLPAVNTPQFDWVKSRLPRRAQPVPPIFQPEVPARAICWAAHHKTGDIYLGLSTATVVVGNKMFPSLGDWYLGKTGYKSQQTREPARSRPDNLWQPLPGDAGAHGRFDAHAKSWVMPYRFTSHLGDWLALGAAGVGVAAAFWWGRRNGASSEVSDAEQRIHEAEAREGAASLATGRK